MIYDTLTTAGMEMKLADYGFSLSSCQGEKRTQSVDTWRGTVVNQPIQNAPTINFEQLVIIRSGRVSASGLPNTFNGGVIKFQGVRVLVPSKVDSGGPGMSYEFQGGRYFLDNMQYKQWYQGATGTCMPAEVILFIRAPYGGACANISPGQQIADIINYADGVIFSQTGSHAFQLGTIDQGLNLTVFPSLICKPMTCSAALDKCLELFPRTNEVWDYTTIPPTVNFTMTSSMASVVLPICDGVNHKSLRITKRDDLLARAVCITYRITDQVNSQSTVSYATDQWGPVMESAYQAAGGDGNRLAGNAAAQAKSAQAIYVAAYNAYISAHLPVSAAVYIAADAAGITAVNNAVKSGNCDPREGIRVPSDMIDLSGTKVTTATAYLDCEPVLACLPDDTQSTQKLVRDWWASHRGGGVSELGTTKIRFQDEFTIPLQPNPVTSSDGTYNPPIKNAAGTPAATAITIPIATLSSGDLTGVVILNPGAGYASGQVLEVSGGVIEVDGINNTPAQILVQDVDLDGSITGYVGGIISASIGNGGYYSTYPNSPNSPATAPANQKPGQPVASFGLTFLSLTDLLTQYPNRIVRGTHHSWMRINGSPVVSIKVKIKAVMRYVVYDVYAQSTGIPDVNGVASSDTCTNGNEVNQNLIEHHCDLELTNGITGTYETVSQTQAAEAYIIGVNPVPINGIGYNGIARTLWLLLNQFQFEGNYTKVEASFTNGVTLNNTVNFSGGNADWLAMNAQITGIREDYGTHNTSVQIGPSKHLSACQMSSLLNMFRLRQPWFNPSLRNDNTQDSQGSDIGLPITAGNANTTVGDKNNGQFQLIQYNT